MSSKKYVIGAAQTLTHFVNMWREHSPEIEIHPIEIRLDANHRFDFDFLQEITPAENVTAFVAYDQQFLNFRRHELMGTVKSLGFKMPPLIHRSAIVASDAKISENCYIGARTVIESGAKVGYNSFIGAGSVLGRDCLCGHSVWFENGTQIGQQSRIGSQCILGKGVIVDDCISIGKLSVIDLPGFYRRDIAVKSFFLPGFDSAIEITG